MSCLQAVAGREFRALVGSRAYRTGTLVGLAAVVAFGLWPRLAGGPGAVLEPAWRPGAGAVAVMVDRTGEVTPDVLEALSEGTGLRWVSWQQQFPQRPPPELSELRRLAVEGRIAAYAVVEGTEPGGHLGADLRWVVGANPDEAGFRTVERAVQAEADRLAARARLRRAGVSPEEAAWLLAPAPVERDRVLLPAEDGPSGGRAGPALLFLFVLYVTLVVYGTAVANGIAAEKGGRVVEMLLAAAAPEELLRGKLLGMGKAAGLQYAVWAAAALATAWAAGGPQPVEAAGRLAGWAAAAFLMAFAGYAPLFAAAGSLAGRPEEVSQTTWLPLGVLVGAYLAAVAAMAAPGAGPAVALSLLPWVGPLAMYARLSLAAVPAWQLATTAAVSLATAGLAWRWAEGVYRRCILQTQRWPWLRWPWGLPRRSHREAARDLTPRVPGATRRFGPGPG